MSAMPETTSSLEHKLTITIPAAEIDAAVLKKLEEVAPKANLKGFRAGKVPFKVIKEQFGENVRREVIGELTQKTLFETLQQQKLEPLDYPEVEFLNEKFKEGQPVEYKVTFEVSPKIDFSSLAKIQVEKPTVAIQETDIAQLLEKMREQYAEWHNVERKSQEKDQIKIDFVGMVDGEEFPGGKATDFDIIIGSKRMIPGFEEGLVGLKANEQKDLHVTFPAEYQAKELAGKPAVFKITVKAVSEPKLPELNDAFAQKLGVSEGGMEKLKQEMKHRLESEVDRVIKSKLRGKLMDQLNHAFSFELPPKMLRKEYNQLHQHHHHDHEHHHDHDHEHQEMEQQARKRVTLSLLFAAYIKENDIRLDEDRVKKQVREIAEQYQQPEEIMRWYYSQKQLIDELRGQVFEDQVIDNLLTKVSITEKPTTYDELMNQN